MNPTQLLAHFEKIADAPDAIVRLRRFILDLALRGKLVSQNPEDEPASHLLAQIAVKKAVFAKTNSVEEQETHDGPRTGNALFPLPKSWVWVPATYPTLIIPDFGKKIKTKDVQELGKFPVIDQGKVFIRGYCDDVSRVIKVITPLIIFGDHTRETKLVDFDFVVGADGVKILQPIGLLTEFYYMALQWLPLKSRGYGRHFKLLKASYIPIPPLAEQHRIVAQVNELMALCDQLEAARAERESWRDRLAASSLARLNTPDPESFQDDASFTLDVLPALTTRPDQIKQLRQTILNLAVHGRLIRQERNDEPAADLLAKIARARTSSQNQKKARREREPLSFSVGADNIVPFGWSRATIDGIALSMRYGTSTKCEYSGRGVPVLRIPNVSSGTVSLDDLKIGPLTPSEVKDLALKAGDLLMIRSNGSLDIVGRSAVVPASAEGMAFAGYLVRLRSNPSYISTEYIWLAMNSTHVRDQIEKPIRSAVGLKNVNLTEFGALAFLLPPLAEQHRIVARFNELMAVCNKLKASLIAGEERQSGLLTAILGEALRPAEEHDEAA